MKPRFFVITVLALAAGCAFPALQLTRPATTSDLEKSEARIKEDVQAWNQRQSRQWEVMATHKTEAEREIASLKSQLAELRADYKVQAEKIQNLDNLFWKLVIGSVGAGVAGGVGGAKLRRVVTSKTS